MKKFLPHAMWRDLTDITLSKISHIPHRYNKFKFKCRGKYAKAIEVRMVVGYSWEGDTFQSLGECGLKELLEMLGNIVAGCTSVLTQWKFIELYAYNEYFL